MSGMGTVTLADCTAHVVVAGYELLRSQDMGEVRTLLYFSVRKLSRHAADGHSRHGNGRHINHTGDFVFGSVWRRPLDKYPLTTAHEVVRGKYNDEIHTKCINTCQIQTNVPLKESDIIHSACNHPGFMQNALGCTFTAPSALTYFPSHLMGSDSRIRL